MELVFDIEANGFLFEADTIWCIVAIDENDKVYSFRPDQIKEGIKFLQSADKLIGHNIIGYDIPLIKKLYDINLYDTDKVLDTLTISRLSNPVREGGHSIEKWGYRLGGVQKQVHEDWTQFSEEMLTRCIKDVKINKKLFNYLKKECVGFSKDSILLEHETTNVLQTQHENGFLFDEKEAMLLLSKLNKRKSEVETEVHETFKPKWVDVKEVKPKLKKDGTLSKSGLTEIEYSERVKTNDVSVFMRKELKEFNLGSRQQIGEYLKDFGWKPKNFTPTGQPIVDESTLNKVKHIKEASLR
jgi:DNA polymerase III epsilon subunit-like protein